MHDERTQAISAHQLRLSLFLFKLQLGIPPSIQHYHSICPLEPAAGAGEAAAFGVRSQVLKGISGRTGAPFALRRFSAQQVRFHGQLAL